MSDLESKYPSNSKVPVAKKTALTAVTKANVTKSNQPVLMRLFGENLDGVVTYILWDVLVPALKDTFVDMIKGGADMLIYGKESRKGIKRNKSTSYVSYESAYNKRESSARAYSPRQRTRQRFNDILIEGRDEAEQVLEVLLDHIDRYNVVAVSDFYELVGIEASWADHKYGWDNLSKATIERVRGGYVLDMPKPFSLD